MGWQLTSSRLSFVLGLCLCRKYQVSCALPGLWGLRYIPSSASSPLWFCVCGFLPYSCLLLSCLLSLPTDTITASPKHLKLHFLESKISASLPGLSFTPCPGGWQTLWAPLQGGGLSHSGALLAWNSFPLSKVVFLGLQSMQSTFSHGNNTVSYKTAFLILSDRKD